MASHQRGFSVLQQANGEVGDKHPPEEIEGRVLELGAFEEGQRRERHGERGRDLREASAAKFARHQAGDDDGRGLREDGEEAQPDEGKAEEGEADALEKGVRGG